MPITDLVIVSSQVPGSNQTVRLDISWTPPSTRNGVFLTQITFDGSQTQPYPPERSRSHGPETTTLKEDANSFNITSGLPYAEYNITIQPFNIKTNNTAMAVSSISRTIAIG